MILKSFLICALEHGGWKEGNLTRKAVLCRTSEDEKLCTVLWYYKILYFAKVNSDNEDEPYCAKYRRVISNCHASYSSVMQVCFCAIYNLDDSSRIDNSDP